MPNADVPAAGPGLPMTSVAMEDRLDRIADRVSVLGLAILGLQRGASQGDCSAIASLAFEISSEARDLAEAVHTDPEATAIKELQEARNEQ